MPRIQQQPLSDGSTECCRGCGAAGPGADGHRAVPAGLAASGELQAGDTEQPGGVPASCLLRGRWGGSGVRLLHLRGPHLLTQRRCPSRAALRSPKRNDTVRLLARLQGSEARNIEGKLKFPLANGQLHKAGASGGSHPTRAAPVSVPRMLRVSWDCEARARGELCWGGMRAGGG